MPPPTAISLISAGIAILALILSATTSWFTLLRRGRLIMTKPTIVFFGYDLDPHPIPKVSLRTLLFNTATRGVIVENMYVRLYHERSDHLFGFWGHGETKQLVVGSLYVGPTGVAVYHHFLLPRDEDFRFASGQHRIDVFAKMTDQTRPAKLFSLMLDLTDDLATQMQFDGVMFELQPDTQRYVGHTRGRT